MESLAEARIRTFLRERLKYGAYDCGAVLYRMRKAARVAGFELDRRFSHAGLAAGPEARVAAAITDQALGGGGGDAVSAPLMRTVINRWIHTTAPKGM